MRLKKGWEWEGLSRELSEDSPIAWNERDELRVTKYLGDGRAMY